MTGAARESRSDMKVAALSYAENGIPILRIHSVIGGRCSGDEARCRNPGKHPRTECGPKDATTALQQMAAWWQTWPEANIGIPTGLASGLFAADVAGRTLGPPKGSNRLYIPPGVTLDQLQGLTISLVIVEGEQRAFAPWRFACHDTETSQFIPAAIAHAGQLSDVRLAPTAIVDGYRSARGSLSAFRSLIAAETGP